MNQPPKLLRVTTLLQCSVFASGEVELCMNGSKPVLHSHLEADFL